MSWQPLWLAVLLATCVSPLAAKTYYVGTCHAGSFATISAAVGSPDVEPGSIVKVCPGAYYEQVIISKPLTLEGMVSQNGSQAQINGNSPMQLATSAVFGVSFYPLVWITAGPVKIQNLSTDDEDYLGEANPPEYVGFYFASGGYGSLTHVASHGVNVGSSVWMENANTPATSVMVRNSFLDNGIVAIANPSQSPLLTVDISNNQDSVNWGTSTGSFGVYLSDVGGTVTGNSIWGRKYSFNFYEPAMLFKQETFGVYDNAPGVIVSGNNIMFPDYGFLLPMNTYGVVILADQVIVKSNKIGGTRAGIDMECHHATVSGNTINLSVNGLVLVPSGFTGVNTFYNTGTDSTQNACP
jgi:hypothetical protein